MELSMLAIGSKITDRDRAESNGLMALFLKDTMLSIKRMVKVNLNGLIMKHMLENSKTIRKMGMEYSASMMVDNTREIG